MNSEELGILPSKQNFEKNILSALAGVRLFSSQVTFTILNCKTDTGKVHQV